MAWRLDAAGLLAGATYIASPNFDDRPDGAVIELLVVHNISLPPGQFGGPGIIDLFTNRLDPNAHPYYRQNRGREGLQPLPHPSRRGTDPVRTLQPPCLACGAIRMAGPQSLQ